MTEPMPQPPESLAELVKEHPGLILASGLVLGLLAGALLPHRSAGKLAKGAASLAGLAGELGLSLGKRARNTAGEAARVAGANGNRARKAGIRIAQEAVKLAVNARK